MVFNYDIMDKGHNITFDLYYGLLPISELSIMSENLSGSKGHIDFTTDNDGVSLYLLAVILCIYSPVRTRYSYMVGYYSACVAKANEDPGESPTRFKLQVIYGAFYKNRGPKTKFMAYCLTNVYFFSLITVRL
jgi:hypothetical protein